MLNDENERDDYHDQLVACIETHSKTDESQERLDVDKQEIERLHINAIAAVGNSEIVEAYTSYKDEQDKDDHINWIKELILEYADEKPSITQFENKTQRMLFK